MYSCGGRYFRRYSSFATCHPVLSSKTDLYLLELSLTTYTSTKQWLVLGFIPMAWTFVCPTEVIAFSDAVEQFQRRGASIVFASTDSEYSLLAWANTSRKEGGLGGINIPLLSDKSHKLSKDYGVLIEEEGIALRGIFLIDPKGIVRQVSYLSNGEHSYEKRSKLIKLSHRSQSTIFLSVAASTRPSASSMPFNSQKSTERCVQPIGILAQSR